MRTGRRPSRAPLRRLAGAGCLLGGLAVWGCGGGEGAPPAESAPALQGLALDEHGRPLAGAAVEVERRALESGRTVLEELTAGEDGSFRLRPPRDTELLRLRASAPGREPWMEARILAGETPEGPVPVLAARVQTLQGSLRDEAGRPLPAWALARLREPRLPPLPAGAAAGLLHPAGSGEVQAAAGEDRVFRLRLAPGRWKVELLLGEAVLADQEVEVAPATAPPPLDLRLGPELVHGQILGPAGRPAEEAVVRLSRPDPQRPLRWETGAVLPDGRFWFQPGEGPAWVLVSAKGCATRAEPVPPPDPAGRRPALDLRLAPECVLEGRLLDPGGAPAAGVLLGLVSPHRLPGFPPGFPGAGCPVREAGLGVQRTRSDGRFAFTRLAAGKYEILAWPEGPPRAGALARAEAWPAADAPLGKPPELVLRLGEGLDLRPRLHGRLLQERFALPPPGARLELRIGLPEQPVWVLDLPLEEGTGAFDAPGLPPEAPVELRARAPGCVEARWSFAAGAVPPEDLELRLPARSGRLLLEWSGSVPPDLEVRARSGDGARYAVSLVPGASGRLYLDGLPRGTAQVEFRSGGGILWRGRVEAGSLASLALPAAGG